MRVKGLEVRGVHVDEETRCAHHPTGLDVVAVKFRCCGTYYSCYRCHEELAGHAARVWPCAEFASKAVLCGACGREMTVREYLGCGNACPSCGHGFNPGCEAHHPLYFEA